MGKLPDRWAVPGFWYWAMNSCHLLKNEYLKLLQNEETRPQHPSLQELVERCHREGDYQRMFLVCERWHLPLPALPIT